MIRGRLEPEVGAVLIQALAAAREELYQRARAKQAGDVPAGAGVVDVPAGTPTMAQQQADALGLLAETALHHGIDPGTPGERYQVDASRVVMRHDRDGRITEIGARTRTIPPALRRASASRSRLSLPGMRALIRSRPSHPPLGARRTDDAVEPGIAMSASPPRVPRGGVPGRAGSRRRAAGAARRRRAPHSRANRDARLAGRAPRRWICDRRLASGGRARPHRRRIRHGAHLTALQPTPIIGATFAPEPCVRRSRP